MATFALPEIGSLCLDDRDTTAYILHSRGLHPATPPEHGSDSFELVSILGDVPDCANRPTPIRPHRVPAPEDGFGEYERPTRRPRTSVSDVESTLGGDSLYGLRDDVAITASSCPPPPALPKVSTPHYSSIQSVHMGFDRSLTPPDSPFSSLYTDSPGSDQSTAPPSPPLPGSPGRRRRTRGASTNPMLAPGRNHICSQCSSRFLCKSKLDRHMLTHSGHKPFACFCGKRFNQKSALKNHTRRHLKKGDAPFENIETTGLNGFSYDSLLDQIIIP